MGEESWMGELCIDIAGLQEVSLGKVKLVRLEEKEETTIRVCPNCHTKPKKLETESYHCEKCNITFKNWFSLKKAIPIDNEKGLPLPERQTKKTERVKLKKLDLVKVKFLPCKAEYGIIALDDKAKRNLQIIGLALKEFKKAIVFNLIFHKNGKEHIFYITVGDDNKLRAREIIPLNKVKEFPKEMEVYTDNVQASPEDLKKLIDSIPEITEEELKIETEVDKALKTIQKVEDEQLKKLREILSTN